jgi:hypothetical protein
MKQEMPSLHKYFFRCEQPMQALRTILFLSLLVPLEVLGQLPIHIVQQIINADTVMLVSHRQTDGVIIMDHKGNKKSPTRLEEGKVLNKEVILKQALLGTNERQDLVTILKKPFRDRQVGTCQFIPFNAIAFVKKGRSGFIEVSLECRAYLYMQGSKPKLVQMDNAKWMELSAYFEKFGIADKP